MKGTHRFPTRLALAAVLLMAAVASGCFWMSPEPPTKNVILMISDGAGYNAFHAASYYEHGRLGEQPYDKFPVHFGCTTFMLNYIDAEGRAIPAEEADVPERTVATAPQGYDPKTAWSDFDYVHGNGDYTAYTDSAAAATAIYTGRKTTDGRLSTNWDGTERLVGIAQRADTLGKAVGTISSVQASHATPAAFGGYHRDRNEYAEIFNRMLDSELDVILGCGHPAFNDGNQPVEPKTDADYKYVGGRETWLDLTDGDGTNGFAFLDTKEAFEALAEGTSDVPEKLVGIARCRKTLQYQRDKRKPDQPAADTPSGDPLNEGVPDLPTMARAALRLLSRDSDGFVLQIEGGAVDWANHANNLPRMIEEQIDFNRAVATVVDWVETNSSWDETLLIVTSDHECGRIWGPGSGAASTSAENPETAAARFVKVVGRGAGELPEAEYHSHGHSNALVPLWAIGRGSERFAELVDGTDTEAGRFWGFSGQYVDNTAIHNVMQAAIEAGQRTASDRQGLLDMAIFSAAGAMLLLGERQKLNCRRWLTLRLDGDVVFRELC